MSQFDKAAILGATGPTGLHLARLLETPVRVVSRSEDHLARVFPGEGIERVAADATRETDTLRAIEGCDVVFDCIGLPSDSMHLHPFTARNIAGAIRQTGARCVQVSSYWAYLPVVSLPVTEDHPRTDGPEWARLRRESEDILLEAGAAVLHLPDFYGPHVHTSTLQNALTDAVHGRPMNWIGAANVEHDSSTCRTQ